MQNFPPYLQLSLILGTTIFSEFHNSHHQNSKFFDNWSHNFFCLIHQEISVLMEPNSPSSHIPIFSTFTSPFDGSNDPKSSTRKPLSLWPGMYHSPVTNALWETRSKIFESLLDPPLDAPPQSELLTRTPSQSRMTILYNFSSDYTLREQYRDPWNEVRIGKLLEDLDALAGTISFKVYNFRDCYIFWFEIMGIDAFISR